MKIVVLDGYVENPGDLSWDRLAELGELVVYDRTPADLVTERIGTAEIVYTNKVPITQDVLEACPNIRFIGVLATGYNIIDIDAAKSSGIAVCNIPDYGSSAVAQFAIAMLLEICHHIAHHDKAVHDGRWQSSKDWCFWDYPLIELAGKTLGIIGLGRIGKITAGIARALGMSVIAHDKYYAGSASENGAKLVTMDELLNRSDVIVLHCPLTAETAGIINRDTIRKMKDGVILINNRRGPLLVEQDVAEALNSGKIYAAGLDVVAIEPIAADNPLLHAKNCLITPHISWAPRESRQRLMNIAIDNLIAYLDGRPQNNVAV